MSNVIYLRAADRSCKDCGCQKALKGAAAKHDVLTIFSETRSCERCGDEVEAERAPSLAEEGLACDDCGQPDNGDGLTAGTVMLPYNLGKGMVLLCDCCLQRRDSIALGLSSEPRSGA